MTREEKATHAAMEAVSQILLDLLEQPRLAQAWGRLSAEKRESIRQRWISIAVKVFLDWEGRQ